MGENRGADVETKQYFDTAVCRRWKTERSEGPHIKTLKLSVHWAWAPPPYHFPMGPKSIHE